MKARKLIKVWTSSDVHAVLRAEATRRGDTISGLCRLILTIYGQELTADSTGLSYGKPKEGNHETSSRPAPPDK